MASSSKTLPPPPPIPAILPPMKVGKEESQPKFLPMNRRGVGTRDRGHSCKVEMSCEDGHLVEEKGIGNNCQRTTIAISIVALIYYAHLAAVQMAQTLFHESDETSSRYGRTTSSGAVHVPELLFFTQESLSQCSSVNMLTDLDLVEF
ncbi:hypothetical protein Ahy_A10g047064 [Arachis hypogaea]|uniref:Uncharacterized protein n=1 Tax=Arachis hypogaea TaxID=3818 RepID=A0A445B1J2_ARAHY|nr:hypothetical protein Ahy_A10g047064 [Arachis hypogaea]